MKHIISSIIIVGITSSFSVAENYSSHAYFYTTKNVDKCRNMIQGIAEKLGFYDIQVHNSKPEYQDIFSTIRGKNNKGYTFQFVCEGKKGFGYLIINGNNYEKQKELKNNFAKLIFKKLKNDKQ